MNDDHFVLHTDASFQGVGAVLSVVRGGEYFFWPYLIYPLLLSSSSVCQAAKIVPQIQKFFRLTLTD